MKNSIPNDLIQLLDIFNTLDGMPVQNFYTCRVGAMGRVIDPHRVIVSVDSTKEKGIRADRIDDLTQHSKVDHNPLVEPLSVVVAYFPKKNRFKFYVKKNPANIRGAIANLSLLPDFKNHVRDEEYIASWKIHTATSKIFPGKFSEPEILELLQSDHFYTKCASQVSRYLRLNSVQDKSYQVEISPITDVSRFQFTSRQ
tara:strand:+ start:3100 stop:3696 length:597 start_codon:yes stop_codon:yes gene_type:complete